MNPKLLTVIVASMIGVGIFSAVMFTISEDEFVLNEQQIQESMQKEVSKSPKITGVHAQNICMILELICTSDKIFPAAFDPDDGHAKFSYTAANGIQYSFRLLDDHLQYKTNRGLSEWRTVGDDIGMWDDKVAANGETANDNDQYVHLWQFSGDELGYYERWCDVFDGDWLDGTYRCGFKDLQDYNAAKKDLTQVLNPSIEGEQSKIFCEILHKECDERVSFRANYDPRTDVTYYDGISKDLGITIRIIENKISYADEEYPDNWIEWDELTQGFKNNNYD